jgi:hypothetical protein
VPAASSILLTSPASEHSNSADANFLKKNTGTFHPHIPTGIASITLSPAAPQQICLLCRHTSVKLWHNLSIYTAAKCPERQHNEVKLLLLPFTSIYGKKNKPAFYSYCYL